jgi:molecular chaperone DnaK (HSP70)
VGDGARNQLPANPENTIYAVKRLIGRKYEDKTVQSDRSLLAYKIVKGKKNGEPLVSVTYQGKQKEYTAEEISAMILQKMKDIAESVCRMC